MKKIIGFVFSALATSAYPYDLINYTYLINNTNESIKIQYEKCSAGLNKNVVCGTKQTLIVSPINESGEIGKIENSSSVYDSIHIIKIESNLRIVEFASVSELNQYVDHGFNETDIMMCSVFNQSYQQHIFIESDIDNQLTCRTKEMFNT